MVKRLGWKEWLAIQGDRFYEASELVDGKRCDRVTSPEYVFLDGRGAVQSIDGVSTSGSLVVRRGDTRRHGDYTNRRCVWRP
jgi:hypothetical protein